MEAVPLKGLNDLLNWGPSAKDYYLRSSLRYRNKLWRKNETSDVLVCHDLCGGYLEDRWRHGTDKIDGYKMWNWWKIDLFVYFSHNLVTIPPSSWIDAAHRHGVKILGTFITEWDIGRKTCSEFLDVENHWKKCADQLIEISSFFNFDGWLINIENDLEPSEVSEILRFVKYLNEGQKSRVQGSTILWYDSVTSDGELQWQNELNSRNASFCEACDGIFLNYGWNENLLKSTLDFCTSGSREKARVFVGCDVFGSECHCIADYNSARKLEDPGQRKREDSLGTRQCFEMSKKFEMSFAIFAPSWTHEALGAKNFTENERRFWNKLDIHPRRKLTTLPIVTSFCQGFGSFYHFKGKKLSTDPWSNMSLQTLQPLPCDSFINFTDDSFVGGSCLKVSCGKLAMYKLFDFESSFDCGPGDCLTVRWFSKCPSDVRMAVVVELSNSGKSEGTECRRLYNRSSESRPDDGEVILRLLSGEEEGENRVNELPLQEGLLMSGESRSMWGESCHTLSNVYGKSLKGVHLFVAELGEEVKDSHDLLLGYFEMFTHNEEEDVAAPTCLEASSVCEVSVSVDDGDVRVAMLSASEVLHSFALVFFEKDGTNSFEIKSLDDLLGAVCTSSYEQLRGPSGVYLCWRLGHGRYPCEGRAVRFHVFVRDALDSSEDFCSSPTPIVELDRRFLGRAISSIPSDRVLDLSIKVECFVF